MKNLIFLLASSALFLSCMGGRTSDDKMNTFNTEVSHEAQAFIDSYTATGLELRYVSAKAQWASNTMIIEGDTMNAFNLNRANEALSAFSGSIENIEKSRYF